MMKKKRRLNPYARFQWLKRVHDDLDFMLWSNRLKLRKRLWGRRLWKSTLLKDW